MVAHTGFHGNCEEFLIFLRFGSVKYCGVAGHGWPTHPDEWPGWSRASPGAAEPSQGSESLGG